MKSDLSRDPRESSYWCRCFAHFWEPSPNRIEWLHTVTVREIHNAHSHTDYVCVTEQMWVCWRKEVNSMLSLDDEWTPVPREVFEEVKQQFLMNISLRYMKPFQETETVLRDSKGTYLFYKPIENQSHPL